MQFLRLHLACVGYMFDKSVCVVGAGIFWRRCLLRLKIRWVPTASG